MDEQTAERGRCKMSQARKAGRREVVVVELGRELTGLGCVLEVSAFDLPRRGEGQDAAVCGEMQRNTIAAPACAV